MRKAYESGAPGLRPVPRFSPEEMSFSQVKGGGGVVGRGGLKTVLHRGDQLAVAGVAGELPEEGARETLVLHVRHIPGDGRRSVVAPPVAAAVGVGRAADRAGGRAAVL